MTQKEMPSPDERTPEPTPAQVERARERQPVTPAGAPLPAEEPPGEGRDEPPSSRERLRNPDSPWMGGG